MTNELLENLEKLHTTELGAVRIKRNLGLETGDAVAWCKNAILTAAKNIENEESSGGETCGTVHNEKSGNANSKNSINKIFRKGKNWYIKTDGCTITVNAYSYTVITAHKEEENENNNTIHKKSAGKR
ncbi:DUF3781 domain-containing protein [uncultured Treponema sp.]|uniref:DUF3781 domain-containing protein n=1 Tax=uncultured Treponema sp. TaxID=162155 RepID=UPI0025D2C250|nr:DUF3781 domain-containing protein [uncultured Treponema sp.]